MKLMRSILRRYSFIFLMIAALVPLGCGEDEATTSPGNDQGPVEIEMQNTIFTPATLRVDIGTTVTWINNDGTTHTVTSGNPDDTTGLFDSGNMGQNDEFSFTFNEIGDFEYFCKIHPSMMQGTIIVRDPDLP